MSSIQLNNLQSGSAIDILPRRLVLDAEDKRLWEVSKELKQKKLKDRYLLGWPSVVLIIANRMIGSGIFLTPSTLMQLTQSVGITLLFWVAGAFTTLCGAFMFMEYGLRSPRFSFRDDPDERKQPLPRSGGDLFYLKDVVRKPAFLAVCLYGPAFILLANIATNSMAFGVRVLEAAGRVDQADPWEARGIALAVIIFTCALHSMWRIGGIHLSNVFAVVKIAMLLLIFITGCLTWGGVFQRNTDAVPNMTAPDAFKNPSSDAYAFAQAYLSIVFAYGGFNQANYILGEVKNPQRNYKWPAFLAVLGVCVLYILVNISYMLVVPAEEQKAGINVALRFFQLTYGSISPNAQAIAPRILAAFMGISALGNLIVMTYTAARVKQEIAKEGILPFCSFFANPKTVFSENNQVPLGALILHGTISSLFVLATAKLAPLQAYKILVGLYSYTIDAIFGVMLSIGIILLRIRSKSFSYRSFLPGWISIGAASIYGLSMAFPVFASFVPPSAQYLQYYAGHVPWYAIAVVSWCCVALGGLWWIGFTQVYPLKHKGDQLRIERELVIGGDELAPTLEHETILFFWRPGDDDGPVMHEEAFLQRRDDSERMPLVHGRV